MYVIVPRNEHFCSHKSGFIVCTPLRLRVSAVYELFRLEMSIEKRWLFEISRETGVRRRRRSATAVCCAMIAGGNSTIQCAVQNSSMTQALGITRGFCAQQTAAALRRRRRTPVVHISYFTEIIKEP